MTFQHDTHAALNAERLPVDVPSVAIGALDLVATVLDLRFASLDPDAPLFAPSCGARLPGSVRFGAAIILAIAQDCRRRRRRRN